MTQIDRQALPVLRRPRRFSLSRTAVYLLLFSYLVAVVYPMFWLLTTSLKADQDIFYHPFSLPNPAHLQWSNFSALGKGTF